MTPGVRLRPEEPGDHAAVRALHEGAFGTEGRVVARLVDALREGPDPAAVLSLVAERAGRVAGHVMLTPGLLDAPRRLVDVRVLSPLAVHPGAQRQGIGAALVRAGLAELDAAGVPAVLLEGDPGYYPRLGFAPGGPLGFRRPSLRIPEAAFQVVLLRAHEPWMTARWCTPRRSGASTPSVCATRAPDGASGAATPPAEEPGDDLLDQDALEQGGDEPHGGRYRGAPRPSPGARGHAVRAPDLP